MHVDACGVSPGVPSYSEWILSLRASRLDGLLRKEGKSGHTNSLRQGPSEALSAGSSVYSSHILFLGVATSHYAHPSSSPALATLAWSPPFSEAWRLGHSRMLLPYSPRPRAAQRAHSACSHGSQPPRPGAQHDYCVCSSVLPQGLGQATQVCRADSLSFQQTLAIFCFSFHLLH